MKLISWNIAHRAEAWRQLLHTDADIALLQEAGAPPADVATRVEVNPGEWRTAGISGRRWRTAIVRLSNRVELEWLEARSIDEAQADDLSVSHLGTLSAAVVTKPLAKPLIVASMYGLWQSRHLRAHGGTWSICADTSVHRVISDLSVLIGHPAGHRILAAGDLNILNGYG